MMDQNYRDYVAYLAGHFVPTARRLRLMRDKLGMAFPANVDQQVNKENDLGETTLNEIRTFF